MAWGNPALCRVGGATWGLVGGAVPISRHCSLRRHLARGGRAKLKCIFLASAAVMKEKYIRTAITSNVRRKRKIGQLLLTSGVIGEVSPAFITSSMVGACG